MIPHFQQTLGSLEVPGDLVFLARRRTQIFQTLRVNQLHPLVPLVPSLRAYLDLRVNLLLLNFPKAQLDQLAPLLHPRPLPPFDLAVQGCLAYLPDLWAQGIRVHHAFP